MCFFLYKIHLLISSLTCLQIINFMEKDVFFVLSRAWDKEKILSPHEESNLRPSDPALRCSNHWATETTVSEIYYEVHMTRVLHTARISNVDSVMFVDRNKRDGLKRSFEQERNGERCLFLRAWDFNAQTQTKHSYIRNDHVVWEFERVGIWKSRVLPLIGTEINGCSSILIHVFTLTSLVPFSV